MTGVDKVSLKKKLGALLIVLVLGVLTYVALLYVSTLITRPNGLGTAVIVKEEITENTVLTKDNVNTYFEVSKTIDGSLMLENSIEKVEDLVDMQTIIPLEKGEVMSTKKVRSIDSVLNNIKEPIEVSIKANDVSQMVGGTLREGDLINICITDAYTKEDKKILPKVYISGAYGADGTKLEKDSEGTASILTIIIPESVENTLNEALLSGAIRISKIKE